jgi:site-specific DNA recombinase
MKYAVYVRVSTEEQAQHGFSIDAQKEKGSAFVTSQDGQIYNIYVDDGYSGKDLKRPALQSLLQDAEDKQFDIVLIYKLDRFSRRLSDLVSLGERFEKLGVGIKSVTEPFDTTTPAGKLMFNMLGSFAQFERELIGERTKMGVMRRIKNGSWSTTRPFGYDLNDGKLTINKAEAEIAKKCYKLFLEYNLGIKLVAQRLNEEDLISRRKGKWSKNSVWTLLTNPVYTGRIRWDGDIVKGQHNSIVSKELFSAVQERLKEKDNYAPWVGISPNLFIGLIFCVKCGSPLSSVKPGNGTNKGKYRYYACGGRRSAKCRQDYIRADILEESILSKIKEIAGQDTVINDYLQRASEENNERFQEFKLEKLQTSQRLTKLSLLKDKKINWLLSHLPNRKVSAEISIEIDKLLTEIEKLKQRLAYIGAKIQQVNLDGVNTRITADFLQNFIEMFDKLENGQRKLLIQSVVKRIEVHSKNKIRLQMALPILPENERCESSAAGSGASEPSFASLPWLVPRVGLEPTTHALKERYSTN